MKENPNLSELVSWISATGDNLEETLSYTSVVGGTTFLAPTNAAFEELYKTTPKAKLLADKRLVNEVLRLHRITGRLFSTDLPNLKEPVITANVPFTITPLLAAGSPNNNNTANNVIITSHDNQYQLVFDVTNGAKVRGVKGGMANITATDLLAINGLVHTIDKVLIP